MVASLVAGVADLGPTGYSVEICKEMNFCKAVHCTFPPPFPKKRNSKIRNKINRLGFIQGGLHKGGLGKLRPEVPYRDMRLEMKLSYRS